MKNTVHILLIGLLFSCAGGGVPKEESYKERLDVVVTSNNDTVVLGSKGDTLTIYKVYNKNNVAFRILTKLTEVTQSDGSIKKYYINNRSTVIATEHYSKGKKATYLTLFGDENVEPQTLNLRVIYSE